MTLQEPDRLSTRAIVIIAIGSVAVTIVLVVIAWAVVTPPPGMPAPSAPSPLENRLFGATAAGPASRERGLQQLGRYEWVDRGAHLVRIPIERAMDAVAQDPGLIGSGRSPEAVR